jgi:hypothetical protein
MPSDYFENLYNAIDHLLKEIIRHGTELSTTTASSNEEVTSSSAAEASNQKDNSFVNDIIKSNRMDNNQPSQDPKNTSKCTQEAQEATALAMLRPHRASESTTSGSELSSSTTTTTTPSIASSSSDEGDSSTKVEDLLNAPTPQTLDEAMNHLNRLKAMHDDLLVERERNNKFVERYQEKVAKADRMATLHQLIPRELFVREDRYQQELEHVYKWSGISDKEIAEIYQTKLRKSGVKQHGASSTSMMMDKQVNKDPYAGFIDE